MKAIIRWKSKKEGGRQTPPGPSYRTVARFDGDSDWPDKAWTLVIDNRWFSSSGEVTLAEVRFLMPEAPQTFLKPGARFQLLEGDRIVATGLVMAAERTLDEMQQLATAI